MSSQSPALHRTLEFFESLSPDSLTTLSDHYDSQARFIDPFNDVQGVDAIAEIFADMYEQLDHPGFTICSAFENQSDSDNGEHQAFVTWDFNFRFKRYRPQVWQKAHGSSHLRFNTSGRIQSHQDYWDSAQIYQALPLLGPLMHWLKGRMGSHD